ncbi:hypothetical protein Acry_3159 (plasmid) [Acidiphilium cryptum JF-5]|uniref:Transposase n=1 Tax=Acidiphilium cryptum (strain JF-5) TaxID=349163 RepID=A5FT51_ACICJ|nr:hypothetical protein Acry_3159 [Acidiphilium cryptum JF-5]
MLGSRIHRRKPAGKPMPRHVARANGAKSSIRAHVEHVFAHQKNRFGRFIRTITIEEGPPRLAYESQVIQTTQDPAAHNRLCRLSLFADGH